MKEKEFIEIIKTSLKSNYIGDDCAYLKDLGITITQDSLVENVHFKMEFTTPYKLGYKAVMTNISDIVASGAKPKYLTISLSMPANIDKTFIKEFYEGCKTACGNEVEIVGGDLTGADKIYISICAIGSTQGRKISSRSNAKIGQKVIVSGMHGGSSAGLNLLLNGKNTPEKFINAHLLPEAQVEFGRKISTTVKEDYAMMDTSDGLMDALSAIANSSKVLLDVDFEKIPFDKDLKQFPNYEDLILYGGEDYQIIATVPKDYPNGIEIGEVKEGLGVDLTLNSKKIHFSQKDVEEKLFNHFKN